MRRPLGLSAQAPQRSARPPLWELSTHVLPGPAHAPHNKALEREAHPPPGRQARSVRTKQGCPTRTPRAQPDPTAPPPPRCLPSPGQRPRRPPQQQRLRRRGGRGGATAPGGTQKGRRPRGGRTTYTAPSPSRTEPRTAAMHPPAKRPCSSSASLQKRLKKVSIEGNIGKGCSPPLPPGTGRQAAASPLKPLGGCRGCRRESEAAWPSRLPSSLPY